MLFAGIAVSDLPACALWATAAVQCFAGHAVFDLSINSHV
jgi:hypothetical protein